MAWLPNGVWAVDDREDTKSIMAVQLPPFHIGEESEFPGEFTGVISESRLRSVLAGNDRSLRREQLLPLVLSSTLPDRLELIRSVLEDLAASSEARRAAAVALGRLNSPEAEDVLIRALDQTDRQVLSGAVKALGWIGGPGAYRPLLGVRGRADETVVALAEFSARLVAHRHGLAGTELPPLRMPRRLFPGDAQRTIDFAPARDERIRICLRSIATRSFGMRVDEEHLYEMLCEKSEWMLLLDRRFVENPSDFLRRRSIPCAAAVWTAEHETYSIGALGLFEPESVGVAGSLRVCRSMGEPVFDGSLRIDANGIQFAVYAVARPGAFPLVFEGTLDRGEASVSKAFSGPISVAKQRPVPLALRDP